MSEWYCHQSRTLCSLYSALLQLCSETHSWPIDLETVFYVATLTGVDTLLSTLESLTRVWYSLLHHLPLILHTIHVHIGSAQEALLHKDIVHIRDHLHFMESWRLFIYSLRIWRLVWGNSIHHRGEKINTYFILLFTNNCAVGWRAM